MEFASDLIILLVLTLIFTPLTMSVIFQISDWFFKK